MFSSSADQGPPVLCSWQAAPHPLRDASESITRSISLLKRVFPFQFLMWLSHHSNCHSSRFCTNLLYFSAGRLRTIDVVLVVSPKNSIVCCGSSTDFFQLIITLNTVQGAPPHTPQYSSEQHQLIEEEVRALLQKGAVSEIQRGNQAGFYSNLFLVPKKDGGQRPVINLNLKPLNQAEHFKMEGIHTLRDIVKPGDWLGKADQLKDTYHPNPPIPQGVSKVQISGDTIPVQLPPIWPVLGTLGLYQDPQASDSPPSGDGSADYSIHR